MLLSSPIPLLNVVTTRRVVYDVVYDVKHSNWDAGQLYRNIIIASLKYIFLTLIQLSIYK